MPTLPDNLINKLMHLGFTNYEARTYLGLLKNNPATGYEISHEAGVPRSVIYSTLRKMEALGYVISIHDKPSRYIPLSPKQLLAKLESDFSKNLTQLSDELTAFNDKTDTEGFWNIRGYRSLIEICNVNIREAKKQICLSAWKREIDQLQDALLDARKRGVEVIIFSFNRVDTDLGRVYSYDINEDELSKIWDHKLILISDGKDLIMGPSNNSADEQVIWTQNKAVLNIAMNYIVLDITLYGQRLEVDVSDTVLRLMTEPVDDLDRLIQTAEHSSV